MRTGLCDLLGIDLPIVQAPMGSASCPALAAAVSNAGGLGMLALSWTRPDDVRRVIRETRALTQRPFGINLVLDWAQEERLAVCLEERVPVISFFFGDALPFVARVHAAGAHVGVTVGSAGEARVAAAPAPANGRAKVNRSERRNRAGRSAATSPPRRRPTPQATSKRCRSMPGKASGLCARRDPPRISCARLPGARKPRSRASRGSSDHSVLPPPGGATVTAPLSPPARCAAAARWPAAHPSRA